MNPLPMLPEIQVYSGTTFNFAQPSASIYGIEDIAHALANTCRFSGHTRRFYSVAQHCAIASLIVPEEHAYAALMHDAAEAFICDLPAPLKMLLPDYAAVEREVETAIFHKFRVPYPFHASVKQADMTMLATEKRDILCGNTTWHNLRNVLPLEERIIPLDPAAAKELFLKRYDALFMGAYGAPS